MEYLALQARWLSARALALDPHVRPCSFLLTSSDTPRRHNRWLYHRYLILSRFIRLVGALAIPGEANNAVNGTIGMPSNGDKSANKWKQCSSHALLDRQPLQ
jgi:hypothetical protein